MLSLDEVIARVPERFRPLVTKFRELCEKLGGTLVWYQSSRTAYTFACTLPRDVDVVTVVTTHSKLSLALVESSETLLTLQREDLDFRLEAEHVNAILTRDRESTKLILSKRTDKIELTVDLAGRLELRI